MAGYISGSGEFQHPELGLVRYVVRSQARKFIARWKGSSLQLTIPPRVSAGDLHRALESMMPRLISSRPETSLYRIDSEMTFELFSVRITGVKGYGARCSLHQLSPSLYEIKIGSDVDFSVPEPTHTVARLMKSIARYLAPDVLLPRATQISETLGVAPAEWRLTYGRKTLGRCDSRRVILLSDVLVFMPSELRDYVICHELAHLTEMNHSPRFHALCNQYCHGRAPYLEQRLKQFRIPLP